VCVCCRFRPVTHFLPYTGGEKESIATCLLHVGCVCVIACSRARVRGGEHLRRTRLKCGCQDAQHELCLHVFLSLKTSVSKTPARKVLCVLLQVHVWCFQSIVRLYSEIGCCKGRIGLLLLVSYPVLAPPEPQQRPSYIFPSCTVLSCFAYSGTDVCRR
jgi:hypothetical protein